MAIQHEDAFETELCDYLAAHGWEYSPNAEGYDKERALVPADIFEWLESTQPEQLSKRQGQFWRPGGALSEAACLSCYAMSLSLP